MLEGDLQLGVFIHHLGRVVGLHHFFEHSHFCFDIVYFLEGRESRGMNGFTGREIDVLLEKPELEAVRGHDISRIWSLFTGYQAEHGSLTRAVSPDKADLLAGIYLKGDAAKDLGSAVRFSCVGKPEQHKKE